MFDESAVASSALEELCAGLHALRDEASDDGGVRRAEAAKIVADVDDQAGLTP